VSRYFSAKQKIAFLIKSGFKCVMCGTSISYDTCEADHIIPFSKGGKTIPTNGQALCFYCNRTKGDSMKNILLNWQEQSLKNFKDKYNRKDIVVQIAGTGSGKTALAVAMAHHAFISESYKDPIIIFVTPWRNSKRGFSNWCAKFGIKATTNNQRAASPDLDAIICTYASASSMLRLAYELGKKVILVLDEFHHLQDSPKDGGWTEPYKEMEVGENKDVIKAILFSGTPWSESGELCNALVEYERTPVEIKTESGRILKKVELKVKSEEPYTYGMAVNESDDCNDSQRNVVPVEIKLFDGITTQKEFNPETGEIIPDSQRVLDTKTMTENDPLTPFVDFDIQNITSYDLATEIIDKAVDKLTQLRRQSEYSYVGGMFIAMGKEQAYAIKNYLAQVHKKKSVVVQSDDPKSHKAIEDFDIDINQEWLISIDMVSEGVDIPRLKVLGDLTNKKTLLHIIQRWGRVLRRCRDKNGIFLDNPSATVFGINHPKLNYAAMYIENDVKQYEKKDKPEVGEKPVTKKSYQIESQESKGVSTIAHGQVHETKVSDLAVWLWDTDYHDIREGRRAHTDCYWVAKEMIRENRIPKSFSEPVFVKPEIIKTYDDEKLEAVEKLKSISAKVSYTLYDGEHHVTQIMLNKAMGLRSWNYKVQSLEDINKRISIAKSMLDAGEL